MTPAVLAERVRSTCEQGPARIAERLRTTYEQRPGLIAPRPRRRRWRILLAAGLALLVAASITSFVWLRATVLPADAAFRVGDHVVSVDDLNHENDTMRALYGVQPPTDPARLDQFHRDSAKAYAVAIILDDAARDAHIVIPDKTAQDVLNKFVSDQLGDGPDAQAGFVNALGQAGTTQAAVLNEIKRQLAVRQLMDQKTPAPQISEDQIRQAFTQRQVSLGTPEQRHLMNIVVADKAGADNVISQLQQGHAFADVAKTTSLDQSTRDSGGDLGQVAAAQLDPNYAEAAFAAPLNGTFGPVQTQAGWDVGQVTQITPAVPATYDKVHDQLRDQLALERTTQDWREWLGAQIWAADVVYADDYRPADPTAAPEPTTAGSGAASAPAARAQEPAAPAQEPAAASPAPAAPAPGGTR